MIYVLFFLIIVNSAFFYALIFNKRFEETLFFSFFVKILILFLSGIIGSFLPGYYLILASNIGIFVFNVVKVIKNKKILNDNFFTLGFYAFFIIYVFLIWVTKDRMAIIWDEFSHWALAVKNMYFLDSLALNDASTIVAKNYLSGSSIFQYFFIKLFGSFNEGIMYFAHDLLLISIILPIFKNFKEKKWIKSITFYLLIFVILFLPALSYWNLYTSLYVDCMLGFAFFGLIYNYYTRDDSKIFNCLLLIANFMFLIFVKDFGILLALLCFAVIIIDELFIKNKFKFKKIFCNSMDVLIGFACAVIVKIIWGIILSTHNLTSTGNSSIFSSLFNLIKSVPNWNGDSWQYTVIGNFINECYSGKLIYFIFNVSYLIVIIIFFLFGYFLYKSVKDKQADNMSYKWMTMSLIIGAFCYAFAILLAYLTIFGEYEGVRLASYLRYMNSYAVALIMLAVFFMITKFAKEHYKLDIILILVSLVLIISMDPQSVLNTTIFGRYSVLSARSQRVPSVTAGNFIVEKVEKSQRVYLIATNDDGFSYWKLRYEVAPLKTNIDNLGWSIGQPYSENDLWTKNITVQDWAEILLNNYDYVYLYKIDDEFIELYGDLFITTGKSIEPNQLYKINKNEESMQILEIVE